MSTKSSKKYPFNGPTMADQADICYYWRSRAAAVAAMRKGREKR